MYYRKLSCNSGLWQQHSCRGNNFAMHAGFWGRNFMPAPPVNIEEKPESFEVYVFAPGYSKEDFSIGLTGNIMSISLKENAGKTSETNWVRREYQNNAFDRNFELGNNIDASNISARYNNGVLQVTLPKKVADASAQNINVE